MWARNEARFYQRKTGPGAQGQGEGLFTNFLQRLENLLIALGMNGLVPMNGG